MAGIAITETDVGRFGFVRFVERGFLCRGDALGNARQLPGIRTPADRETPLAAFPAPVGEVGNNANGATA